MMMHCSPAVPWFQRFIFLLLFAMKIIKINLWNQGSPAEKKIPKKIALCENGIVNIIGQNI
jgi:hypothetical protein